MAICSNSSLAIHLFLQKCPLKRNESIFSLSSYELNNWVNWTLQPWDGGSQSRSSTLTLKPQKRQQKTSPLSFPRSDDNLQIIKKRIHGAVLPVMAFMNVAKDRFSILKKGSRTGNLWEPHNTVCSKMWGTPVLSMGVVRKATLKKKIK